MKIRVKDKKKYNQKHPNEKKSIKQTKIPNKNPSDNIYILITACEYES